jgi:hypothetical protein
MQNCVTLGPTPCYEECAKEEAYEPKRVLD